MKFIASSSELLVYLQSLSKVVPSRSVLPLIENFLFELSAEGLKITATDLETTMTVLVELDNIEGEGKVAVASKRLLDILKEFPEQPLIFEINEETKEITITSETGKYTIPAILELEEFPEPSELEPSETHNIVINPEILNKGINTTFFSIGEDELRPVMNGIFFEIKNEYITFVASDSHKLVRYRRTDIKSDTEASFILAKKPADLIKNILPRVEQDVKIDFDNKNAVFELDNYKITCRLIEGNYPDYEAVVPQNNDKRVEINRNLLSTTIRRVSLFSNEASKLVKFYFHENQAEISAQDLDFSISAYEQINCRYDGEPLKIGFKSTFLLEILHNLNGEEVAITMTDPTRAALVLPIEQEDQNEDILMLVMPMMIDE